MPSFSVRAVRYKVETLIRSHFMSGRMRKPPSVDVSSRYKTLSASDTPVRMFVTHWVRDAGKDWMYGLTIVAYSSGVSWIIELSCFEYLWKRQFVYQKGETIGDEIQTLRICVSVAGHIMLILASGSDSCFVNQASNHEYWISRRKVVKKKGMTWVMFYCDYDTKIWFLRYLLIQWILCLAGVRLFYLYDHLGTADVQSWL